MTQSIEELAGKRQQWVEANRENGFESGLKRLLTDLYPDNAHFIYELLQNAEDAQAKEVRFILHEDHIEFEHNGEKLFSIQDVDAITSIGTSTKRDDVTKIGKFGVGFKAVFAYTESPEIRSGKLHFQIRDMVVPFQVLEPKESISQTHFILPFNNPKKSQDRAKKEIENLLKALNATTLLFLTQIEKIEYLLPDSSLGYIKRINLGDNKFEIRVQQPNESNPSSSWFLKFDKEVQIEDEEAENDGQKQKNCRIAVAFGLSPVKAKTVTKGRQDSNTDNMSEWKLMPMSSGRVCIYFPAEKEISNLQFHLHAPFASTVARDSVRDFAGNKALRDHLAELLAESMISIRDQGLLTVPALAILPSDEDKLPEPYKPIMDRLVQAFQEHALVPMRKGGHAPASAIFRGKKALLDLIDDDDLVRLLGGSYSSPIWLKNPPQQNQRENAFLSMLGIKNWGTADLVKALGEMSDEDRALWMSSKDDKWHQTLYEMLMDYLDEHRWYGAELENKVKSISTVNLILCSDGIYRKGKDCYFPTAEVEEDSEYHRVSKRVYPPSKNRKEKVFKFLNGVGVREVNEKAEIEKILEDNYSQEAILSEVNKRDINHIRLFSEFLKKHPECSGIFHKYYIFNLERGKWGKPCDVYLDSPFLNTELREWYESLEDSARLNPLSERYKTCNTKLNEIAEFAEKVGVTTHLKVERAKVTHDHPEWHDLSSKGGERFTGSGTNVDYLIPHLREFLASPSISKSRLVWHTIIKLDNDWSKYSKACFSRNSSYCASAESTLVHDLRIINWIPQKITEGDYEFVSPHDAIVERLPEGFGYQTGWQWLRDIGFGANIQAQRKLEQQELERQTKAYKQKEDIAKELGFDSLEEAEEITRLKKEEPEIYERLLKRSADQKKRPLFPTRSVDNPEHRQKNLDKQLSVAPRKKYTERPRSTRTTKSRIDPNTWLRSQYTNVSEEMPCQICKDEMPFRKRDGEYYFEAVEIFTGDIALPQEYEAQYLALCPVCAAKYKEFVKKDRSEMIELRESIISTEDCEIPITLGDTSTSIRFVETHFHDIKHILEERKNIY
ncbi:hypothetical protein [Phormidium sp. FACHB-1136]|uniref:sacsin N-terminal ATP-binding-like domain-containing protein n=1 Tax=Phormidium sp. FACHB-1136 TaxID=2692848 RepID=UPI001688DCC8|nr:hypothetical protein [Phormidium sp. FACHB-1136]MBD2428757.1 hypothetical protein [Phormidium sp. FACHB-1136]